MKSNLLCAALTLASGVAPAVSAQEPVDLDVVHRIRAEALNRSQVMRHVFWLSDVHGPRLTNSPGYDAAAAWVVDEIKSWGIEEARLETWGPFGRGWSSSYFEANLLHPQAAPLIGVALPWTPGTNGKVEGTPVYAPLPESFSSYRGVDLTRAEDELEIWIEHWRGRLRGRIVLLSQPRALEVGEQPTSDRLDSEELEKLVLAPKPGAAPPVTAHDRNEAGGRPPGASPSQQAVQSRATLRQRRRALQERLNGFLVEEGAALTVRGAWNGRNGTVFPPRASHQDAEAVDPPASIALTSEHYNRIVRLVEAGLEPRMRATVEADFQTHRLDSDNVVAEIRGRRRPEEVVILGAHLDDVSFATGATDNAAGCAVMMEAMRILETLDLDLDRTVRMVLWSGEEQGLLGSRAYVERHYGDPRNGSETPEHERVSAYYNLDNGTGKIRGVYLQGNDMLRPIFADWIAPLADLGVTTLSIRNTGGTDHLNFDRVGIPGFQFIQDPVEYDSITHHSNMDVYDNVQEADLAQAAAVVAVFAYQTANRDDLLPRKPVPTPPQAHAPRA